MASFLSLPPPSCFVIPAEAGIQIFSSLFSQGQVWIPVYPVRKPRYLWRGCYRKPQFLIEGGVVQSPTLSNGVYTGMTE
jgi:hypothetical protein